MRMHFTAVMLAMSCWIACSTFAVADDPQAGTDGKRYVIIHADDAGMSHSVNRGTIDSMLNGIVSSVSIMVPCPWLPEFAAFARENPDLDYGIHLTLNSEWENYRWHPVAGPAKVPSLCDQHGYLWDNVQQVAAHAKAEEVEIELRAQIERAKQFGIPLSHLDTHMGSAFARPDIARVYAKLGIEYGLPILFVRPNEQNMLAKLYPGMEPLVAVLDEAGLPILDELHQFYQGGPYEQRKKWYLDAIRNAPEGVTQIIIHCGYDDAELRGITTSHQLRDSDRQIFMDPEVIAEIEKTGVEIITWKKFGELHRAQRAAAQP